MRCYVKCHRNINQTMPFLWRWSGKKSSAILLVALEDTVCWCTHLQNTMLSNQLTLLNMTHKKKKRDNKTERWQNKYILALDVHFMRRADSESVYCQREKQKQEQTQNRNKNENENKNKKRAKMRTMHECHRK